MSTNTQPLTDSQPQSQPQPHGFEVVPTTTGDMVLRPRRPDYAIQAWLASIALAIVAIVLIVWTVELVLIQHDLNQFLHAIEAGLQGLGGLLTGGE